MNAKTGEIVAMVGGRDYSKSQLNRITGALREQGSVFHPFVYATALNSAYDPVPRVITPATIYIDEPKTFTVGKQEYSPNNYGDMYTHAPVTLRDAFVQSLNVITVEVAMEVTLGRVMNLAAKGGLPKPPRAEPAMALGSSEATPMQVASAYTAFATLGTRTSPLAISRITTRDGVAIATPTSQKNEVLRPQVAYMMTSFMKDVINRGVAMKVKERGLKANVAGKTGTSRDGWFVGYTPNLVCVVWVGFDDGSQLALTGANSALPIWTDFMQFALTKHPEWQGDWQMPEGIDQVAIDPRTGKRTSGGSTNKRELFINGTAPEPELVVKGAAPEPANTPSPITGQVTPPKSTEGNESGERREGTITLDIDPTTGLIAVESCPVIRTRTFVNGAQPRKYCGPEYHGKKP
jgi:penicillin-binding protein 1B